MDVPENQLVAARNELAEAWVRANPGKTEADMPEALRMTDEGGPSMEYLNRLREELKKHVGSSISEEDFMKAHRAARGHAGGKRRAVKRAEQKEAEAFREQLFAESHNGVLVALWLTPAAAAELAVPEGEAADSLHVTLCYGGDADALSELEFSRLVARIDSACGWRPPLEGVVSGYGRFNASTTSDGQDVFYASVDLPGLSDFRNELTMTLAGPECNYQISRSHDFNPHITLAYVDVDAENPVDFVPGMALRFNMVTVIAGERRVDIPFAGFRSSVYSTAARDDGSPWRLFVEQAFNEAGVPEMINVLPKPGTYSHPSYGKISITQERNQRFIQNFDNRVYQQTLPLTLDIEHDGKNAGAIGYFERLEMREDGSVDAVVNWTSRGKKLMEEDAFRYFSPEWWDKWTDPESRQTYQDVLIGGAICTRPFFKESALRPLVASEAGLAAPSSSGAGVMVLQPMDYVEDDMADEPKGTITLTEEQFKQFEETRSAAEATATALAESEKQRVAMAEQVKSLTEEAQRRRFSDLVMGRGGEADGAVWVGGIEENVDSLVALAAAFGEGSDQFNKEVALRQKTAVAFKESKAFTPLGTPEGNPDAGEGSAAAAVDAEVTKLMKEDPKLDYATAAQRVFSEKPELHEQYRAASTKRPGQ